MQIERGNNKEMHQIQTKPGNKLVNQELSSFLGEFSGLRDRKILRFWSQFCYIFNFEQICFHDFDKGWF